MSAGEIDYPVKGWLLGEPLPDLDRLPRARWREVLAPLSSRARDWTIRRVAPENIVAAVELDLELAGEDEERREAMRRVAARGQSLPEPRVARTVARQLNLKVSAEQMVDLRRLAEMLSLRPTQLARMLVLSGVRRMLYEEGRRAPQP